MRISDAIKQLEHLKQQHGDIDVETDCEHCGRSTHPTVVAIGPKTARLQPDRVPQ